MGHAHAVNADKRSSYRLYFPHQTIVAALPPPLIWNWFSHCQKAYLVNASHHGIGLVSSRPLTLDNELIVTLAQFNLRVVGQICHQHALQNDFYSGLCCYQTEPEIFERLLCLLGIPSR